MLLVLSRDPVTQCLSSRCRGVGYLQQESAGSQLLGGRGGGFWSGATAGLQAPACACKKLLSLAVICLEHLVSSGGLHMTQTSSVLLSQGLSDMGVHRLLNIVISAFPST